MPKLTKETMRNFRNDFEVTAKLFENKYGIKLSIGNIRFDANSFRTTMSGLVADPFGEAARSVNTDVVVIDPAAHIPLSTAGRGDQFILAMAGSHGVKLELSPKGFIGSKYRLPHKRSLYTITGINQRAPKFCIEVETDSGARYKMPVTGLASAVLVGHKE